ncbi:dihydrodipicolinate synthase family protein [Paracoccus acridae]|uniref:Dihydrodipicolinate synthase family protein n=1 Tax=Paracoccus acridae TaxID=1795310 RepID=A0ABQ1VH68_9RHOB|nr:MULTISPECIES: dihydrodipicolinate synthase family protein [Paracoccus]GGF64580.1 dihydrodipicolinate synthase family protein [Paracoccus acridae]
MTVFKGLSAFPITPADADGRVMLPDLQRILRHVAEGRPDSICVLGSTGGYAYLDPDQRRAVAEAAVAELADRVPVIVGVGALRTDTAVGLTRHAADLGAAGLLVAPMSYTPLTEDEVFHHFAAIAAASDLPVCIYNNPGTTHFTFSTALLARLATLPTVRGVKMPLVSSGDYASQIAELRAALPKGFSVGYSVDWVCAPAMLAGADAFYSVAAGLWPDPMLRLVRAARQGDAAKVGRIDATLAPLWDLFRTRSSFRTVHHAANLMGLTQAQPPRPILPLSDHDDTLRAAIAALDTRQH